MPDDATQLLGAITAGDRAAMNRLLPLIYEQLHGMAESLLRRERKDHTLQPTALVNEAYLRLVDQTRATWNDRTHFMAIAATAMRRILVDHARARGRDKRGGPAARVPLDENLLEAYERSADLVALDEALKRLESTSPDAARLVEMRFFGNMTMEEAAAAEGSSLSTAERLWRFARAWLYRELEPTPPEEGRARV